VVGGGSGAEVHAKVVRSHFIYIITLRDSPMDPRGLSLGGGSGGSKLLNMRHLKFKLLIIIYNYKLIISQQ